MVRVGPDPYDALMRNHDDDVAAARTIDPSRG
jgi:hypothetical protein